MGGLTSLATKAIKAYHGSPHLFDRFDMNKVGRGQKAQAYGHGLYFAENPQTAADYRRALEHTKASSNTPGGLARDVMDIFGGDRDRAVQELEARLNAWRGTNPRYQIPGGDGRFLSAIDVIKDRKPFGGSGSVYKVDLEADPERFLDWEQAVSPNHPLAQDVDSVYREAMRKRKMPERSPIDKGFGVARIYQDLADAMPTFNQFEGERLASKKLREAGVPGIKYLDQLSRDAGNGTYNFSVFDDDMIKIRDRYKRGGLVVKRGKR